MSPLAMRHGHVGRCVYGCPQTVITFMDNYGFRRQLDLDPLPATVDVSTEDYRHRLWVYRGRISGWQPQDTPVRRRGLRSEHDCEHTPAGRKPRRSTPVISPPATEST